MRCLPCPYPAERQGRPELTIWCCLPGPSGRRTPSRSPFGGSICPRRRCCRTGALPSPSSRSLILHPPQISRSKKDVSPRHRYPAPGHRRCAETGDQGSTSSHSLQRSPQLPPSQGTEQGQPELPGEHRGSRPGWQGWICTKRRGEERAKVELTYRWLFKSIKGR